MASGAQHTSINLTALGLLGVGYAAAHALGYLENPIFLNREMLAAFTVSYFIGTFLLTPDLDLSENRVRAKSNWGILGVLWVPYGRLFRHRGMSHSWVLGPLTRLVYLVGVTLFIGWLLSFGASLLGYRLSIRAELGENWPELALGAVSGYYLSQWLHLVADGVWPDHGMRRLTRRRSRR